MKEFQSNIWTVNCDGHTYTAIGYETRGIFKVPIVEFDKKTGDSISATVYEIVKGFKNMHNVSVGADKLNATEIALLESVGCEWTGCWIRKVGN